MLSRPLLVVLGAFVALVVLWQSAFMVRETEFAMNLDWGGKIVRADYAPGLHFKEPFVEQVKKFHILPRPFGIDTGELTPTLKVKRRVVAQKFSAEIEEMYRE